MIDTSLGLRCSFLFPTVHGPGVSLELEFSH